MKQTKKKIEYSIIIPVFNSAKSLNELHLRLIRTLQNMNKTFELILVDDYSKDDSWKVMQLLHSQDKRVKIIQLIKNFGQHNAIMCGCNFAKGEFVITMDDDLQHPPEEISKLINKLNEGYYLAYGKYDIKNHSLFRNIGSWMINQINQYVTGRPCKITSFRIIKKEIVKELIKFSNYNPSIDTLLVNFVPNSKVSYCTVVHHSRKQGRTNYSLMKLIKFAINMLFDHSTIPLKLATLMGFIFSSISGIIGIFYLTQYLTHKIQVSGYTSLILAISFFSGLILFVLGVLGEYINQIFLNSNNKPQFIIKQKNIK